MSEQIYTQLIQELEARRSAVLVTIIFTQGSTPRKSGSKMLVGAQGRITGTIGGGALEKQAEKAAIDLLREEKSAILPFGLQEEGEYSIGMACGGDAQVLFQYVSWDNSQWVLAVRAVEACKEGDSGWLLSREDGEQALFWPTGTPYPEQLPACLTAQLRPGVPQFAEHWLAEPVAAQSRVLIFGAGHISKSLVPILASVDFRAIVFDNRKEFAAPDLFPQAERVICGDYSRLSDYLKVEPEDYVIILTHGHEFDFTVQAQVMRQSYAYLGVIGSAKKTAKLNTQLLQEGFTPEQLAEVHTPIGLPILAQTPSEIAISIAGELVLVRARRRQEENT